MSKWSPRAAHATEDYRNRIIELDGRIAELEGQRDAYADRAVAVYRERKFRIAAEATIEAKERIIVTLVSERRANRKLLKQAEAALAAMNIEEGS